LPPDLDIRWDWQYADVSNERIHPERREVINHTIAACIERFLTEQNRDGGWADVADSQRREQSSEPDVSGAVVELLAGSSDINAQTAIKRGCRYLRSRQRGDGSWMRTDGTLLILCTSASIRGLLAAGASADDDCIASAVNWLVIEQQPSGGWRDSATQTAWAILGLVAAGKSSHAAVRRGIEFLVDSQDDEGGWIEQRAVLRDPDSNQWLRNELHTTCWPLLALARFAVAASSAQSAVASGISLRLAAVTAEI
jgi:squalene-hopene/tetraprenyl-beta-curcumene cyclase